MSDKKKIHLYQSHLPIRHLLRIYYVTYFKILPLHQCPPLHVSPLAQGVLVVPEVPETT